MFLFVVMIFMASYILVDVVFAIKGQQYQNLWNKEKAMIKRIDPAITRAELCEQYVIFCKKNKCRVDF